MIRRFGQAIERSGESGGGNVTLRTTALSSGQVTANFTSEKETDRIQMSFTELTRHARVLTVDELPGQWFTITFSDPDYTLLLAQDDRGTVRVALVDGAFHDGGTDGDLLILVSGLHVLGEKFAVALVAHLP